MDINQLNSDLSPQPNDQLVLWDTTNGCTRRTSISAVGALINSTQTVPGGILAISCISLMRARPVSPTVFALTATATPFNPFLIAVQNPPLSSASAFAYDLTNGNFVAQRDVALAEMNFSMIGTWANGVDLTLQAWVGPDATPFVLTPSFIDIGTATMRTANFGGIVGNPNNLNNVIKAGEKVKLAGKLATPGNLTITSVVFSVQSLDGQ